MSIIFNTYTCPDGSGTVTHTWAVDTTKPVMWHEGNFYRFNATYVNNIVTKAVHNQKNQQEVQDE